MRHFYDIKHVRSSGDMLRSASFVIASFITFLIALTFAANQPVAALPVPAGPYVAMGDSVAAGLGLPVSGEASAPLCGRSALAYPTIIADNLGVPVQTFACSGAKLDEGIYATQEREGVAISSQLEQAYASGSPGLITITIGANDMRWTQFIRDCYVWRCGSTLDKTRFKVYLTDLKYELVRMFAELNVRSNGNPPRVLISGYYNPLTSRYTCSDAANVTSTEISWINSQTSQLNNAIRSAANRQDNATFAPISFKGHELCSPDPWVQGLASEAPFHPTTGGQEAIAQAFLKIRK